MRLHRAIFINLNRFRFVIKICVIVVCMLLSLTFVFIDKNGDNFSVLVRNMTVKYVSPMMRVFSLPMHGIAYVYENIRDLINTFSDNKYLREQNYLLMLENSKYNALKGENERLSRLLNYSPMGEKSFVTAQVVFEDSTGFSHSLIAYTGERHNVKIGQIAINEIGVIGRVENIGNNYARIMLITDINSKIPVMIERNRTHAILSGDNTETLQMIYMPFDPDVQIGDTVITSGVAGQFPSGLPIGTVYEIKDGKVKVTPLVDLKQIEYIKIVDYGLELQDLSQDVEK